MLLVVSQDVANCLVNHGEKSSQGSQSGIIHDVIKVSAIFQAFVHQAIRSKVWLHDGGAISLDL